MLKKTWICKELYVTSAYGFRKKGMKMRGNKRVKMFQRLTMGLTISQVINKYKL
jgi:hypothetical protein